MTKEQPAPTPPAISAIASARLSRLTPSPRCALAATTLVQYAGGMVPRRRIAFAVP